MSARFPVLVAGSCYCDPVFCVRQHVYEATSEPATCEETATLLSDEYVCGTSMEPFFYYPPCEIPDALKLADPFPYRARCDVVKVPDVDIWEIFIDDIVSVHEGAAACEAACGAEEPL